VKDDRLIAHRRVEQEIGGAGPASHLPERGGASSEATVDAADAHVCINDCLAAR